MSSLKIEDRYDRQTILSDEPHSPAAKYVRGYYLRSLHDLQLVGIIPKSMDLDHLQKARDEVFNESGNVNVHLVSRSLSDEHNFMKTENYTQAYSASQTRRSRAEAVSAILSSRHRYSKVESDLLAKKVLSIDNNYPQLWRRLELEEDLLIHSPAVVAPNINSIVARDIVIYGKGTLIIRGSYMLMTCRSLSGETFYLPPSQTIDPNKPIKTINN